MKNIPAGKVYPNDLLSHNYFVFSDMMVRSILSGKKTQKTALLELSVIRILDERYKEIIHSSTLWPEGYWELYQGAYLYIHNATNEAIFRYEGSVILPGTVCWVRERWGVSDIPWRRLIYQADTGKEFAGKPENGKWNAAKDMPKGIARIFLRIADNKILKLEDITEEIAQREGFDSLDGFKAWWGNIPFGRTSPWEANPWVIITEFEKINS